MKAHSHGQHGAHQGSPKISSHLVKGAAMSTGAHSGKVIMSKISKHPLLLIGIGMAAGYLAHKYRKEIIGSVTNITDKGKDFVHQQKENLEDIVAEAKEADEK